MDLNRLIQPQKNNPPYHMPSVAMTPHQLCQNFLGLLAAQLRWQQAHSSQKNQDPQNTIIKSLNIISGQFEQKNQPPSELSKNPSYMFLQLPHVAGWLFEIDEKSNFVLSRASNVVTTRTDNQGEMISSHLIVRQNQHTEAFHCIDELTVRSQSGTTYDLEQLAQYLLKLCFDATK